MAAPDGEGAPGPSASRPAASGGLREPKTGVDFPRRTSACSSWVVCMSCATCCVRSSTCASRCFSCFCSSALERPPLDDGDFGSSANALLPHIAALVAVSANAASGWNSKPKAKSSRGEPAIDFRAQFTSSGSRRPRGSSSANQGDSLSAGDSPLQVSRKLRGSPHWWQLKKNCYRTQLSDVTKG